MRQARQAIVASKLQEFKIKNHQLLAITIKMQTVAQVKVWNLTSKSLWVRWSTHLKAAWVQIWAEMVAKITKWLCQMMTISTYQANSVLLMNLRNPEVLMEASSMELIITLRLTHHMPLIQKSVHLTLCKQTETWLSIISLTAQAVKVQIIKILLTRTPLTWTRIPSNTISMQVSILQRQARVLERIQQHLVWQQQPIISTCTLDSSNSSKSHKECQASRVRLSLMLICRWLLVMKSKTAAKIEVMQREIIPLSRKRVNLQAVEFHRRAVIQTVDRLMKMMMKIQRCKTTKMIKTSHRSRCLFQSSKDSSESKRT